MPHQIIWSWYTGCWWVGCYIWYNEEGTGRGPSQPSLLLAVPKCNSPPINGKCIPITVLLCNGSLLCGFHVPIKWLKVYSKSSVGYAGDTVVERRSLTGELSLSCARPTADGWPLMWVNHVCAICQPTRPVHNFRVDEWVVHYNVCHINQWRRHLVNAYEV